jgi:hypothetical protein
VNAKYFLKKYSRILKHDIKYTSLIFDSINIVKRYRREIKVLKSLKRLGADIIRADDLYMNICEHNNKVCHIIGSGWSLNDSIRIIEKNNSFIIGFNHAALSGLIFDLYLIEPDYNYYEITNLYPKIIDDLIKLDKSDVLMKNVFTWDGKDIGYLMDSFGERVSFIYNIGITCGSPRNLHFWGKVLSRKNRKSIIQYKSSAITAIIIAKNSGFKKIVIHGVDFGGKYFYDADNYLHLNKYKPPEQKIYSYYQNTDDGITHPTAATEVGIQYMIPIINTTFIHEDVSLYCATGKSPLANMLPIYNHE